MGSKKRIRTTTLIICGLAAFLAGIGLAKTKYMVGLVPGLVVLPAAVLLWRPKNAVTVLVVILLGLSLGWWRGVTYLKQMRPYKALDKRNVVVEGVADSDALYGKQTQLSFDLAKLHIVQPYRTKLPGKIAILGFGTSMVYRGDMVRVTGKLYPTRGSRQASIGFSEIAILYRSHSYIDIVRRKFQSGMLSALPEPHASFAMGLLIGQRNTLPDTVTSQLSAVGLTHIVAVSGYNLTIIIMASRMLLKRRSKYQATTVSLLLIVGFLLLTGMSASIVRAAIVSSLSLLAWYYGRRFRPLLLLFIAAVATVAWYPIYLWSDIGWYLSFLAFYGILIIAPLVTQRIYKARKPQFITALLIETLAAQLMTFPIIMYIFGQFSIIAVIANLLIVPLVPLAMLLSFIAGLAGMLLPMVAGWAALPARLLLTYMLDLIALLSRLPFALAKPRISAPVMVALYAFFVFVSFILWRKTVVKSSIITDIEQ